MRKTGLALYTIFALLFAGLPIFVLKMSALGAAKYEEFTLTPWLWAAVGAVALCLIPVTLPKIPDWLAGPLWGCAAFQYRYHCFRLIEPHMVMKYDFGAVLDSVEGAKLVKEAIFTHWAFYPRILEWWNENYGTGYPYHDAVLFNLMVSGFTVLLIYLIARRIWTRQRAAMLAAAIACFWPSFSYYASVTSNEHLAMFFMLLASFFGICAWQSENHGRWAFVLLAGLSAGLADLFKQFSPVFLIAAFGAGLLFILIEGRGKEKDKKPLKRIGALLLAIILMFGCSFGVKEKAYRWLEGYLDMPVCRNATAHFLWIGLNSKGGGVWTEKEGMKVYELAEQYNNDYDQVMDGLMDLLKADLDAHRDKLPDTLRNKMETDWKADIGVTQWVKTLYDEVAIWEEETGEEFHDWSVSREELDEIDFDPGHLITMSSAAYYMCVMGLVALGGVLAIFLRSPAETYLRLVFYGYALLFLLSEAQGRYQVVLFPVFALLAAGACEVAGAAPWMLRKKPSQKGEEIHGT
ncbi:MAG: glycosyltransferase family 39 protein [Firmicutes bacterium]|nr:glycosyltransferase family 39 protein [Bacillota bacterium]